VKRLIGVICFVIALVTLVAFEYCLYDLTQIGSCASGGPYAIAKPCPTGMTAIVVALVVSMVAGVTAGIVSGAILGARAGAFLWAVLFVPLGLGFAFVAHANPGDAIVFYGLAALFIVLGVAPFFMSVRQLSGTD
jgi:hypothetical protein